MCSCIMKSALLRARYCSIRSPAARVRCQHKDDDLRRTERAQREDRSNRLQFWTLLNCTYSWKHCICIKVCLSPLSPSFLLFLSSADLINIFFCLVTMAMRSVDMMLNWIFPELLCSPLVCEHQKSSAYFSLSLSTCASFCICLCI